MPAYTIAESTSGSYVVTKYTSLGPVVIVAAEDDERSTPEVFKIIGADALDSVPEGVSIAFQLGAPSAPRIPSRTAS